MEWSVVGIHKGLVSYCVRAFADPIVEFARKAVQRRPWIGLGYVYTRTHAYIRVPCEQIVYTPVNKTLYTLTK